MATTTSTDRLIFTFLLSGIIHLVIILGVSFDVVSPPTNTPVNNIEITLVKQQDKTEPEEADFLAQADNEGGGELDTPTPEPTADLPLPLAEEPASPPASPVANLEPADVPPTPEPATPQAAEPEPQPVAEAPEPEPEPAKPEPVEPEPQQPVKKITQQKAERKVEQAEKPATDADKADTAQSAPAVSAQTLMMQARNEIHEMQDKLDKSTKVLSDQPKKRRISASTKEFSAAAYMKAWEMKVERIGNMNYPQEARDKGLSGNLMLTVDINPDGSVPEGGIVVSRSSGSAVLDDAAIKIVRLGAPYSAIPDDVLKDNDMLTIIRTWKFETGRGLSAR